MGLMDFRPPMSEEEALRRKEEELGIEEPALPPLVQHILSDFERAKTAKLPVYNRLVECLRAFMFQYSPEEEQSIQEVGEPLIYIPITNMKCRAAKAWLNDIYFEPDKDVFDIKPSPVPELPQKVLDEIDTKLQEQISSIMEKAIRLSEQSGGEIDITPILDSIGEHSEALKEEYRKRIREKSKKLCEEVKKKLKDQFVEGGFYTAFRQVLQDIVVYPTAILKGPVPRKIRKMTGNGEITEEVIPTFNRVSPFDAYPAPNAPDFNADFFIEILHLPKKELHSLIGLEHFDEDAIREVLSIYPEGYKLTREADTQVEQVLGYYSIHRGSDRIYDVLEYWGTIPGDILADWGVTNVDENEFYDVCVWLIDRYVIGLQFNPDPLGRKPYAKASFIEIPDSFWGKALPEVLLPIQQSINRISRAIVVNAVFSSGPMIEVNEDRVGQISSLYPMMVFHAKESAFSAAPAIRFYQTKETAVALIQVMMYYQKMADEYSGIPAYAHGDIAVGTAGRTASGLYMLQSHMTKGVKDVVMNIDSGIITPIVEALYYSNIQEGIISTEEIPDFSIVATGITNYAAKEAQTARLLEFLRLVSNPTDVQIVGVEGRKNLLESIAKKLGIETDKIFPSQVEELSQMLQIMSQQLQQQKPNQLEGLKAMAQGMRKEQLK